MIAGCGSAPPEEMASAGAATSSNFMQLNAYSFAERQAYGAAMDIPAFLALDVATKHNIITGVIRMRARWTETVVVNDRPVTQIAVCWEAMDPALDARRALAREAVENAWTSVAEIAFIGWGKCETKAPGVHIAITDEPRGGTVLLGKELSAVDNGMKLNLAYADWQRPACKADPDRCIRAIAIHEFGHALAFAHEVHNYRNGGPGPDCKLDDAGPRPDVYVTNYDEQSIMNYCNPNWPDPALSCRDMLTAQVAYGERRRISCSIDEDIRS